MEYQAIFGINCGVSRGHGVKYPDYVSEERTISAEDSRIAYLNAIDMAWKFADDYLSNPDNGLTTVKLLSLRGPDQEVPFDASKSVVQRSRV